MKTYNLALLGFGNVGQALGHLLLKKRQAMNETYGLDLRVTAIATGRRGMIIDPDGLDLVDMLARVESGGKLSDRSMPVPQFLAQCQADAVFESIPVNYQTGQPALDYLRAALLHGMHAITANKGPVVHGHRELTELAAQKGLKFYFESTVMDGAPIFALMRETLPAVELRAVRGVLNSTTNLVLQRMEMGDSFDEAVRFTQEAGLAETDPMGDLDGWDASVKLAALSTVVMGVPLTPQQVERTGILALTPADIEKAHQQGKRWKLVCSAERVGDSVRAKVAPAMVGPDSPFYSVNGATSIVTFETDVLPALSIVEGDPSPTTTAYGMLADFLNIVRARD